MIYIIDYQYYIVVVWVLDMEIYTIYCIKLKEQSVFNIFQFQHIKKIIYSYKNDQIILWYVCIKSFKVKIKEVNLFKNVHSATPPILSVIFIRKILHSKTYTKRF